MTPPASRWRWKAASTSSRARAGWKCSAASWRQKTCPRASAASDTPAGATHGEPSDVNSHPHSTPRVSIVHNGIIENYGPLKADLMAKGVTFESETDTEVLVKLIDYFCCAQPKQSPLAALREALAMVRGSYALGVLFREEPDTIYAVKKESPLIVGWGEGENFVASDIPALLKYTRRYSVLEEGDMAVVKADGIRFSHRDPFLRRLRQAGGAGSADRRLGRRSR